MNAIEPKDQSSRRHAIALLEATIAKNEAAMEAHRITLARMHEKQVNRLAELRLQKLLLAMHERAEKLKATEAGKEQQ